MEQPSTVGGKINRHLDKCNLTRPIMVDTGFVEPVLADWAHLVVEPLNSTHGDTFLGPQQAAGKSKLAALKHASPAVGAIVNCTNVFPNYHEDDSISYCRIAVNDEFGANILVYLEGAAKFIHHNVLQGRSVLVHCQMGVSRSATVIIAYLMKYRSMSRIEAYSHVKQRRPMVNPNPGFWKQLELYGQRLERDKGGNSAKIPTQTVFDREWAEQSLATYQTIGHIVDNPVELLHEISNDCDMAAIMFLVVDFVFGRGVLEADLPWLTAICASFRSLGVDPVPLIDKIFTEGSEFMENWSGEVYPERMQKVKTASSVSSS
mmetsp:Transcript_10686/g.18793  ORF Transcript_10686/g.18793 Transcript_10686/m.18793 type:complete len:319 (+) Transcript_10686:181-1137(+)